MRTAAAPTHAHLLSPPPPHFAQVSLSIADYGVCNFAHVHDHVGVGGGGTLSFGGNFLIIYLC